MLGYLYFEDEKNKIPTLQADTIKAGLSLGMIVGQIGCELLQLFLLDNGSELTLGQLVSSVTLSAATESMARNSCSPFSAPSSAS